MRKILIYLFFTISTYSFSQTLFWEDAFENPSTPEIPAGSTRGPSVTFSASGPPATKYFFRTPGVNGTDISINNAYIGRQGSFLWAAEDVDNAGAQSSHQNITWSGINISGITNLSFKGLLASASTSWDYLPGSLPIDYAIVEYRIDEGPWTSLLRFLPNNANVTTASLALELTGDSLAQGEGPALTPTLTSYSVIIGQW